MQPETYRLELGASIQLGRSNLAWLKHPGYVVARGLVSSTGEPEAYLPMARDRLPFRLASVQPNDEESALEFVRAWGLLGYNQLVDPESRLQGEPLQFIWGHAATIQNTLRLIKALQRHDEDALADALEVTLREEPLIGGVTGRFWYWRCQAAAKRTLLSLAADEASDAELARRLVATTISGNLAGVRPDVILDDETSPIRLRRTFRWSGLVEVAYWHLWNFIEGGLPLAVCRHCGGFFVKKDARQQFCPPPDSHIEEFRSGYRTRAQSQCAIRYRQRKFRAQKRS